MKKTKTRIEAIRAPVKGFKQTKRTDIESSPNRKRLAEDSGANAIKSVVAHPIRDGLVYMKDKEGTHKN